MGRRRRQDGTLRPSVVRYRRKHQAERRRKREEAMTPEEREALKKERREWLQRFDVQERAAFFRSVNYPKAIFLRAFARELGMEQEEAWPLLERLADERRWMKLKTKDGMVVGIGPMRRRPKIHAPKEEAA